jgi:crotonobetaine/carnitine-CoA ligase
MSAPPARTDSRIPANEECVLRPLLEKRAAQMPDKVYAVDVNGEEWSYARLRRQVVRTANALRSRGVKQDDHVLCWLPNGIDAVIVWYAVNYLGAVFVPINIAYRGGLLEHVVRNADARLIVGHAALLPRLAEIERFTLERAISVGGTVEVDIGLPIEGQDALNSDNEKLPPLQREIQPWDAQSIIYTSGTTGPSKGVLSSYMHLATMGSVSAFPYLGRDDRFLVALPFFHVGGTLYANAMLMRGGSIAILESFKTDSFWNDVNRTGATVCQMLGVMPKFLLKQAPSPQDRAHSLHSVLLLPSDDTEAIAVRFGVEVYTCFNMTETCMPIVSGVNPSPAGTCGRRREGVEIRLVDAYDCEVPDGMPGELVIRADAPWAITHGYYKNPEATAAAWRNGWFHTGDALRRDADGNYFFVDRLKDAIRRRGENVSSFEVEVEVSAFPAIKEAAAIAVPGEHGDDEIMVVVAPSPGCRIDPMALIEFLRPRMPHYMVPRYVRIVSELPKTPTQKVQKTELRRDGVTRDTWDRELDGGIVLKRERLA